jgi:hypothetical protein
MANKFFENFPEIQYELSDGRRVFIKDFFRKSRIEQEAVKSIVNYTKYEIQDGERPDVVATKLYGNPDLHWTFFLVNDIDNYYDWHMDNETFEKYINKKYKGYYAIASQTSDILTSTSKFLLGEKISSTSSTGRILEVDPTNKRIAIDTKGFVSGEAITGAISSKSFTPTSIIPHYEGIIHYKNSDGIIRNAPASGFSAVTIYDHEYEHNEEKRLIDIIQPGIINQVVRRFEQVMSS